MLYRRDFATLRDAAFAQTGFCAPLLAQRTHDFQIERAARDCTYHRPAHGDAAGEGAKSSDMVTVQPAGSPREISRPPRFKKGS